MVKRKISGLLAAVLLLGSLCACADSGTSALPGKSGESTSTVSSNGGGGYVAPPMAQAVYDSAAATGEGSSFIDTSHLAEGYVGASAQSGARLKFQVKYSGGDLDYNYDLPSDGTPIVCPLQSGSGEYRFRIMQQTADGKYTEVYGRTEQVTLSDDFQPYLRPSCYVPYTASSKVVEHANQLAATASDTVGVVTAVYEDVINSIYYDVEKAATITTGYLSDPDTTLATGKGICVDYAVLVAAMLRSQGIPTKVITGYVAPNDIYHAWNMIWLENESWITVELKVDPNNWNRVDATFAATGAEASFVGDGSNYQDYRTY